MKSEPGISKEGDKRIACIYLVIATLTEIVHAVWFGTNFIPATVTGTVLYEQIPDKSVAQAWN